MAIADLKGRAQTVLGIVEPEQLGNTSPHEHLMLDFSLVFTMPEEASSIHRAHEPVTMKNLGWINYDPFRNLDNLVNMDEDVAISEASLYRRAGGSTMVDTTSVGLKRDPLALARISRTTGINIVMGSGYYVAISHPEDMDDKSVEEIEDEIVRDITVGVGTTGIKAGIIGELGCSWPLTANERKVLVAGARAQRRTGAPMTIHPGRHETAPFEILDILEEAGGDVTRTVMSHTDRTILDNETLLRLAKRGCYIEYDFFGWEISYFSYSPYDMPNDAGRLDFIKFLVDEGYSEKVFMAHDMFGKHRQVRFGGHGWPHILENIAPRMPGRGFSQDDIENILVRNPARWLTFV